MDNNVDTNEDTNVHEKHLFVGNIACGSTDHQRNDAFDSELDEYVCEAKVVTDR